MNDTHHLSILLDLSLNLLAGDSGEENGQKLLEKLVQVLDCSAGRLCAQKKTLRTYHFQQTYGLPQTSADLDGVMQEICPENTLSIDSYGELQKRFPLTLPKGSTFYHILEFKDLGFIILQRKDNTLDEPFLKILSQILNRYASASEREQMKVMVEKSSRMASLGEIAGGIAHEINNPLAVISGNLGILEQRIKTGKLDSALEVVAKMQKTCRRISEIVQNLSVLSRDESKLPLVKVSLREVLIEMNEYAQTLLSKRGGVQFHMPQIDQEHDLFFQGRPVQVSQVLLNLIKNSLDAIFDKPSPWIKIDVTQNDEIIEIRVMDSGIGIPEDLQQKIMDPFFTTKSAGEGTGLGLSLSRNIIEKFGGDLSYDKACANTCFVIRLPKLPTAASSATAA